MTGSKKHTVRQGESVESIAYTNGHYWEYIWEHDDNTALRDLRKSPHVLAPGDVVMIPPIRAKTLTLATNQAHKIRIKGVPSRFRMQFKLDGEPRANEPYTFKVDDEKRKGTTDGDGFVDEPVMPKAREVEVRFAVPEPKEDPDHDPDPFEEAGDDVIDIDDPPEEEKPEVVEEEVFRFDLRQFDPSGELKGLQARLRSLGYDVGRLDGNLGPRTHQGLCSFQKEHGLEVTGELDEDTQDKSHELIEG